MLGPIGSLLLLAADPASAIGEERHIICDIGPIDRIFAGRKWRVVACSDGRSLGVLSPEGDPDVDFYFTVIVEDKRILVDGRGTGDGSAIAATNEALRKLTRGEIAALVSAARAAEASRR
jgi:hypothetical protein